MDQGARWRARCAVAALSAAAAVLGSGDARAYTAAGDRLFPATLVLQQIAPSDEIYVNEFALPLDGGAPGSPSDVNRLKFTYSKTLTDRIAVVLNETWTRLDLSGGGAAFGWQNTDMAIKYLALLDQQHEFLLSFGLDRELGGTGAGRIRASAVGATTPAVFFGKGLGDLDIGYLRPLAVAGLAGYQISDEAPRPDLATLGIVAEYSIPYLQSKVESLPLPEIVRHLTPMTEALVTTPGGTSFGARTMALIAPGVSYAGAGWELAAEMLIPASHATGRGIGVTAQFHLSLDYLFPETIGRSLFSTP